MAVNFREIRPGAAKPNPFTIVIVANPALEAPWQSGVVTPDPIIGQLPAFQAAAAYVDTSLFGGLPGQREALLSHPSTVNDVRVISLYDSAAPVDLAHALAAQDGSSNTLVARRSIYKTFLAGYPAYNIAPDVVYAVSASATHTRASAWFTSDNDGQAGLPFTLDGVGYFHRYYNLIPGTIALPVTSLP